MEDKLSVFEAVHIHFKLGYPTLNLHVHQFINACHTLLSQETVSSGIRRFDVVGLWN